MILPHVPTAPRRTAGIALLALLAGCVPSAPPPAPQPEPRPAPAPPPPAAPAPPADWRDAPITAGGWAYRPDPTGATAMFGRAGAEAGFVARCDRAGRAVTLSIAGTAPATLAITTSTSRRALPAGPLAGQPGRVGATLPASDRFLDDMVYSRGRFMVQAGGAMLLIPSWPEFARAIEDCR